MTGHKLLKCKDELDIPVKAAKSHKKTLPIARWAIINENKGLDGRELYSLFTKGSSWLF